MFKKKENNEITSTVIADNISIKDKLINGTGNIRIDGHVTSNIDISGTIIIGESGLVEGDIRVTQAIIAGVVCGNIYASNTVHLISSAKLTGNIESKALVIDEGALFSGNCKMSSKNPNELSDNIS